MRNYFDVKDEVAFVTGASKGLGKMFATTLAEAGAKVFLVASGAENLKKAEGELREAGYDCMSYAANITDAAEVQKAVELCVSTYGKIDILVNNAGTGRINKTPQDTTLEEWQKVIDINITGSFICAQAVGREMLKRKKGKIINLSSISGKIINKGVHGGSYDVSKQAVDGLTRALASEWGPCGINVNAIAPGYFMTDPNKEFFKADPGFYDVALGMIPVGKMGVPEQLAGTLLYLSSSASDYVHGSILIVDGGYTVW